MMASTKPAMAASPLVFFVVAMVWCCRYKVRDLIVKRLTIFLTVELLILEGLSLLYEVYYTVWDRCRPADGGGAEILGVTRGEGWGTGPGATFQTIIQWEGSERLEPCGAGEYGRRRRSVARCRRDGAALLRRREVRGLHLSYRLPDEG